MPKIEEVDGNGNTTPLVGDVAQICKQEIKNANLVTKKDLDAMEKRIMQHIAENYKNDKENNRYNFIANQETKLVCLCGTFFALVGFTVYRLTQQS